MLKFNVTNGQFDYIRSIAWLDGRFVNVTGDTMTGVLNISEIRGRDANGLKLYDDGGNGIFIKDGGNVGIGTTSPSHKLDVIGDGSFSTNLNVGGTLTLPQGAGVGKILQSDGSGNASWVTAAGIGGTDSLSAGTDISITTVGLGRTISNTSTLSSVTGRGASTSTMLNLLGGAYFGSSNQSILKNDGSVGIGTTSPSSLLTLASTSSLESATLGSELLSSSNWTSTNWTGDFSSGFTHTTGNTTSLTNTLAATSGYLYQIAFTVTGRTAGSFTLGFGSETSNRSWTSSSAWGVKATGTGTFSVIPTSDFNGTIVISIKRITGTYSPTFNLADSTGSSSFEIRNSSASLANTFIGVGAGRYNTTGYNNSAQGYAALYYNTTGYYNSAQGMYALFSNTTGSYNSAQGMYALFSNTTGSYNSAQGYAALYSNTTGYYNSAQGMYALFSNTTGYQNSAQGYAALYSNTTGYNNSAQGYAALYYNTTGYYNSALGSQAGRYISNGSTANTTSNTSLYLGVYTKALADGDTNEIVIGYNAIGNGSNTIKLGNTSITNVSSNGDFETLDVGDGFILKSPDGTRFRIAVANDGTLSASAV